MIIFSAKFMVNHRIVSICNEVLNHACLSSSLRVLLVRVDYFFSNEVNLHEWFYYSNACWLKNFNRMSNVMILTLAFALMSASSISFCMFLQNNAY